MKKGFRVPLRKWLRGPLKEEIRKYSDENFLRQVKYFYSTRGDWIQNIVRTEMCNDKELMQSYFKKL